MSDERRLSDGTRVVHAGLPAAADGEPFLPGPTFAAPFHLAGNEPMNAPYQYGRYGNPTWSRFEQALGELDGGHAMVFSSGMAAVNAVLLPRLKAGDILVAPSDCYMSVRTLANGYLQERGVEVRLVPTAGDAVFDALEGATLVWLESPSNPGLDVADLERVVDAARGEGALVAVDNTLATPIGQQPLALGADFTMTSDSKHISGHGDLVLGHISVRDEALIEELRSWRIETGAIPGPFEIWLAHRSLATLDVRLERGCANALAVAEFLSSRDDVELVRYPGLSSDPAHALASKQMKHFGTVLGFELATGERAQAFLAASDLVSEATSFGGVHTSAERRARWRGDAIGEGYIRFSAGCEDSDDLIADIGRALDQTASV